jgi:glutathione S-transferase
MNITLVIGNKNYSSWSMRPWVLMTGLGIPFAEHKLRFDFSPGSAFRQAVARVSPAGQVPVLLEHGAGEEVGFATWDTLAIIERLHELFPKHGVWPADARRRARARSVCAEMHAGFSALRSHCPMNIEARLPEVGARVWAEHEAVRENVARVQALWSDALGDAPGDALVNAPDNALTDTSTASSGPFLFGDFSAADAMFAPVVMRLATYALPVDAVSAAYMARVSAAPGVARWVADALAERDFLDFEEPYRTSR